MCLASMPEGTGVCHRFGRDCRANSRCNRRFPEVLVGQLCQAHRFGLLSGGNCLDCLDLLGPTVVVT